MASQYPIERDEVEEVVDDEEVVDESELDEEVDSNDDASRDRRDELPEDFSIAARQRLRDELARQVDAFLARGGRIHEIPSNLNASRPRKPVSDFGDRAL